ncbi:hypothetical protein LOC68_08225 [Blastopirellula sp. JC732]|uniref:Uncharacterized protein n=1 Tax=Blastopirellula sediminis TaxID=2894196 RepID=A0A9X1SFJ6_9BACT|nr:hypothetical protein [Blastopirellula sediminis]MCC9608845.1 hypothetical protein [Blastopirellula sediminis]MCC9628378.1 hypothetical protein [Blastopirellula sediminis]
MGRPWVIDCGPFGVTWYYRQVISFGSALLDMLLFLVVGNQRIGYRCGAEYRNVPGFPANDPLDGEAYERRRQQAAGA